MTIERVREVAQGSAELVTDTRTRAIVHHSETYVVPLRSEGVHEIVIDHGTIEVYADGGATAVSALLFPGPQWTVDVDGSASLPSVK